MKPVDTTMHTHFKCSVEHAKAPCTLPATFNNPYSELIFRVRSESVNVNIQVGGVDHLLPTAGRAAARACPQLVPDCVYAVVGDALPTSKVRVRPHYHYSCCRKHGGLDADRWNYRRWWLRN